MNGLKPIDMYHEIRQARAIGHRNEARAAIHADSLAKWRASVEAEKARMAEQEASDRAALEPCRCGKRASVALGMGGWRAECLVNGCGRRTEGFAERADAIAAWNAMDSAKKPTEKQTANRLTAAKVCAMANRMPRALPRKAAFAAAWQIAKRGYYEIAIAGVSYGSRQEALRRLASYDPESIIAVLVPEPDCAHDPDAIAVKVMVNGGKGIYTLGYVPRAETAITRAFLGRAPKLELVGGETKGARIRLAA